MNAPARARPPPSSRRAFGIPPAPAAQLDRLGDLVLELCPRGVGAELVVTGDDAGFVEMILAAAARVTAGQPGPVVSHGGRASGRCWVTQAAAAQGFEAAQQAMRVGSTKRPILSR